MSEEPKIPRDVRLDHIGYCKELVSKFSDPLIKRVKADFDAKSITFAEGDKFQGLLATGSTTSIDADKFLKLFERKQISRAKFLAAITVKKDAALEVLSREELAAISTTEPSTPALRISRVKGVEFALIDAVREITSQLESPGN